MQVVADRAEDGEDPIQVTVSTSNRFLVIRGSCLGSAPQASTVEDGSVLFLVGCVEGITNLTLAQDGGAETIYQIRVIARRPPETLAPTHTPPPTTVGLLANLEAELDAGHGRVHITWMDPASATCDCLLPDSRKIEYESAGRSGPPPARSAPSSRPP